MSLDDLATGAGVMPQTESYTSGVLKREALP